MGMYVQRVCKDARCRWPGLKKSAPRPILAAAQAEIQELREVRCKARDGECSARPEVTCICVYVHVDIRVYVHVCVRTYIHTFIRTVAVLWTYILCVRRLFFPEILDARAAVEP